MAYVKNVWTDRQVQYPNRFTMTTISGTTIELTRENGTVINVGSTVDAAKLNNIENGIEAVDIQATNLDLNKIDKAVVQSAVEGIVSWGGHSAVGQTSITINGGTLVKQDGALYTFNQTTITPTFNALKFCVVYVDTNDMLIKHTTTPLTTTDRRTKYPLTTLNTVDGTTIAGTLNSTYLQDSAVHLVRDMLDVAGNCKQGLQVYSVGGTGFDMMNGSVYYPSTNYLANPNNPHITTVNAIFGVNFSVCNRNAIESTNYQNSLITGINTTDQYDNNGTLTAVPNNKYVALRVFATLENSNNIPNNINLQVIVQRSQNVYDSITDAKSKVQSEYFVKNTVTQRMMLLAILFVKKNLTDTTNTNDFAVVNTDAWCSVNNLSGGGGGSAWGSISGTLSNQTDLQNALNQKINQTSIGATNGVAPLDSNSYIPIANMPPITLMNSWFTDFVEDFTSSTSPFSNTNIASGTTTTSSRTSAETTTYDLQASCQLVASSATTANSGNARHLNTGTLYHLPLYAGNGIIACFKQESNTNTETHIGWAVNSLTSAGTETLYTRAALLDISNGVGRLIVRNSSTTLRTSSTYTFNTTDFYRIRMWVDASWQLNCEISLSSTPNVIEATLIISIQEICHDSPFMTSPALFNVMFKSVYLATPTVATNLISWDYIGVRTIRKNIPTFKIV